MSIKDEIPVEEEISENSSNKADGSVWWDEFRVTGEDLLEKVKELIHEAGVRRIVVKNKDGRTLVRIPMLMGLTGITLLPTYAALALIAGIVTDCSILVERSLEEGQSQTGNAVG